MRISIGFREFPYVSDVVDISIDGSYPETQCFQNSFGWNFLGNFNEVIRRARQSGIERIYVFDSERIKHAASNCYIIHEPDLKFKGEVVVSHFQNHEEYCIRMERRGDFETLLHELMHVSNRLLRSSNPYENDEERESMDETAIAIASEIMSRRFPSLLDDIRSLQINRVIDLIKKQGISSLEQVLEFERYCEVYKERLSYQTKKEYEIILNHYFRDELLSALQSGNKPKLPTRQLWLFPRGV